MPLTAVTRFGIGAYGAPQTQTIYMH